MIKLVITEEFEDVNSLMDGLTYINSLIEQGYKTGYSPNWSLSGCEETKETETSDKGVKIARIVEILTKWGETTSTDLELNSNPCISSHTIRDKNLSILIEEFNIDGVHAVTYVDETVTDFDDIDYVDLSDDIIDEIYGLIEQYDTAQEKLHDSCRDEDRD